MSARIEVAVGADIKDLKASLELAKQQLSKFGASGGQSLQSFTKSTNQASFALTNLGRVAQDAPFGFIGIQNNLNPLLESFQQLKTQTGSTGAALKAMGQSLVGPAGLGIALSVVSAGILLYQQYNQKAKNDIDGASEAIKKQREELIKTPYEKAVLELGNLTRNIDLAKEGLLNKNAVLKQYNEGIGLTIGKVTSLDAAEQALVRNGDKYLQLMFLKANAEVAFKKAAEESYNQAKKQQELDAKKPVLPGKLDMNADRSEKKIKKSLIVPLSEFKNLVDDTGASIDRVTQKIDNINPRSAVLYIDQKQLTELKGNTDKAANIAISAQKQVIEFAKKNGFNLNGLFDLSGEKVKAPKFDRQPEITYRATFDIKGLRNEGLDDTIKDIERTKSSFDSLGKSIQAVTFEVPKAANSLLTLQNQILESGFTDAFASIGESIGASLANGTNLIEAFGQSALSSIGDILMRFGKMTVAAGVAATALREALTKAIVPGTGVAAIIAGTALIAIGAAVKGFSSGIGGGSGSNKGTPSRRIPGFATGVKNFSGGLALVGERGPELVNLPKGSDVIANHRLGSVMPNMSVNLLPSIEISMDKLLVSLQRQDALRRRRG